MTTPMAISKSFNLTKNIPLRSLIHLHLNPIATVNSTQSVSESQLNLRRFEPQNPNSFLRNDVGALIRNRMSPAALCGGEMAAVLARGRAVKIDDEFNEEDGEDDSDEFESEEEDEDEFDEMDGEDCLDDDDEDEDSVYKKRK